MTEKTVEITNPAGLHARMAAIFVQTAGRYTANVWITKDGKRVNAKSIMGLMSLAIPSGEIIIISADGEDEEQAVADLTDLVIVDD